MNKFEMAGFASELLKVSAVEHAKADIPKKVEEIAHAIERKGGDPELAHRVGWAQVKYKAKGKQPPRERPYAVPKK